MFLGPHTSQSPLQLGLTVAGLPGRHWLRFTRCKTFSTVSGNRSVNDGATVDAFPRVKNQEEI
jgi:hypothetical protein